MYPLAFIPNKKKKKKKEKKKERKKDERGPMVREGATSSTINTCLSSAGISSYHLGVRMSSLPPQFFCYPTMSAELIEADQPACSWDGWTSPQRENHYENSLLSAFLAVDPGYTPLGLSVTPNPHPPPVYLAVDPGYTHLGLSVTPNPLPPPAYLECQAVTFPNDPAPTSVGLGTVERVANPTDFEDLELHPDMLVQPMSSLQISTASPPVFPTSTSLANPKPVHDDRLPEDFIRRDGNRYACRWRDSYGRVCGYKSRFGLVKRHVRRVHFRFRYAPPLQKSFYDH